MIIGLLLVLIVLWLLGDVHIQGFYIPNVTLFSLNNHLITLWNLLTFFVLALIIGILPNPFRAIASVFLILWILAIVGIFAFTGLSSILIISVIVGLVVYLFSSSRAMY